MSDLQKALEVLELPEELGQYDGQIQTRTERKAWIYEVTDISSSPTRVYYTIGYDNEKVDRFGLYPLNYIANAIHAMGFVYEGINEDNVATLTKPAKFVTSPDGGYAGKSVYYVWSQMKVSEDGIDFLYEPYETTWKGVVDDMKDPMIRIGYKARIVRKGVDGNPAVVWTSRHAITPKRRIRQAEFLQMIGIPMEEFIQNTRYTFNRVATDPETHINNIAMDIENLSDTQIKSVFYINGQDAQTFDYKTLINSFNQTYGGYAWQYRLHNGPSITPENPYGSTLNVGININADSTINVVPGTTNSWNATTRTITYNPDLPYDAQVLACMEFLPANGKNEATGRWYGLEKQGNLLW